MNKGDTQSVILNFNKNFAKSQASDFTQIVNRQLEIGPNSMVALYTGNLVRKPIVLAEDTVLSIDLISAFPSLEQQSQIGSIKPVADLVPLFSDTNEYVKFDVTVPKGHYSKLSFCRVLTEVLNKHIKTEYTNKPVNAIVPINGGNPLKQSFPYQFFYEMKNDNFFLGLRYLIENKDENGVLIQSDINKVFFEDLDNNMSDQNGVTLEGDDYVLFSTAKALNWNSYALGNTPVRGMGAFSNDDRNQLENDVGYSNCHIQASFESSGNQEFQMVYGMNNTFLSEKWGDVAAIPDTVNINGSNVAVPQVLLGCRLDIELDSTNNTIERQNLEVFCNDLLEDVTYTYFDDATSRDNLVSRNCRTLTQLNLTDYGISVTDGLTLGYEFYSEPIPPSSFENLVLEEERVYYFKVLCSSGFGDYNSTVLYDSKKNGLQINSQLIESGYLFQQVDALGDTSKATSLGLCPQWYFYNADDNLKVMNMRQSNAVFFNSEETEFIYQQGQVGYGFVVNQQSDVNTTSLENILGVAENTSKEITTNVSSNENTLYNPNAYPERPEMAGLTQLGSDKTRYNIELNLPMKCFNTTETTQNDLGQTRPIVYNTNPLVEDVTNISSGLINGNIEPNTLKFLSLNNERPLKLNTLEVKVRRGKTNEIASEIVDTSLELLIQSEPNVSQQHLDVLI